MKKILILVVIALLFIGGIWAAIFTVSRSETTPTMDVTSTSSGAGSSAKKISACDVLTKDVATSVLGQNSENVQVPAQAAPNVGLDSSSCTYRSKIDSSSAETGQSNISALILTVYTPKNKDSEKAMNALFEGAAPGAQKVSGYGEKAYYVPEYGQLNVLKNKHWYVAVYVKDSPLNSSLEASKVFADKLKFQ